MRSNKVTTILDLSKPATKVLARYENDRKPHLNLAAYLGGEERITETVQKYQLKSRPMPNGLDMESWCEAKMMAAIQRLNK